MKNRKNYAAKIMSFIALFAIIIGIVGTAFSFVFSSITSSESTDLSTVELEKIISTFSGSSFATGSETTSGGAQTGAVKTK